MMSYGSAVNGPVVFPLQDLANTYGDVIAANGLERDRTTEEGRGVHCDEIAETQGGFFMDPKKREEVAAKLPKYKELKFPELD